MKKVIVTIIITLAVFIGAFLIYIYSGSYNISQLSHHNALTKWVIGTTTKNSIQKRVAGIQVPDLNDTNKIAVGFSHYNEMCVSCHGAPGMKPGEMAKGLYPDPPLLARFSSKINPKMAFWIIKNGIKMTSMPAFGPTHSDEKIWDMVAFMNQKLDKMSPEEYQQWTKKYAEHDED